MKTLNLEQNTSTAIPSESTQFFMVEGGRIAVHYATTDISKRNDIFESIQSILFSQAKICTIDILEKQT